MRLNKLVRATAVAALSLAVLTGCSSNKTDSTATQTPAQATTTPTASPSTEAATLNDGTYSKKSEEADGGFLFEMTMTVEAGKITALNYEGYNEEGKSKTQLCLDGEYVMTENGPTWAEQAKALAAHVVENQSVDKITMDENGKTDAVAGVSISVNGFVDFAKALFEEAAATKTTTLKDGSYSKKSEEADGGFLFEMTMNVEGGKITSLSYEGYNEEGKSKTQLCLDGEYVMTENGPTWAEQAKSLAAHVVENQSIDKITMDENGKTDAVSGVSISVNGFVDFAKALLEEAAM